MIWLALNILAFCFLLFCAWMVFGILVVLIQAPFRFLAWCWKTIRE